MKILKYIILFTFFLLVGFGGLYTYLSSNPQIKIVTIKDIFLGSKFSLLDAPSESIKGNINNLSGNIYWINRISDNPVLVSTLTSVQQGEGIETGDDGYVEMTFEDKVRVKIDNKSQLDVIQTIPNNIVFSQKSGDIEYFKLNTYPVSIRVKRLLVDINESARIIIDGDFVEIIGSAKIAYNNNANVTKLIELTNDKKFIFNNQNLKVVLK